MLRVPAMLRDSMPKHLHQIMRDYADQVVKTTVSDGTDDMLWGHKPGFRRYRSADKYAEFQENRTLDRMAYEDDLAGAYRDVSAPPNSTYVGWLKNSEQQIEEGQVCTVRNLEYKAFIGGKGRIKNGVCVPLALLGRTDAADANLTEVELAHIEYREYVENAWKDGGRPKPKKEEEEDDPDEDEGEDYFQEGGVRAVYEQTATHTESANIDAQDRAQRTERTWKTLDQHNARMSKLYSDYDQELSQKYRSK